MPRNTCAVLLALITLFTAGVLQASGFSGPLDAAKLAFDEGDYDRAIALCEAILGSAPNHEEATRLLTLSDRIRELHRTAREAMARGDVDAARDASKQILGINPGDVEAAARIEALKKEQKSARKVAEKRRAAKNEDHNWFTASFHWIPADLYFNANLMGQDGATRMGAATALQFTWAPYFVFGEFGANFTTLHLEAVGRTVVHGGLHLMGGAYLAPNDHFAFWVGAGPRFGQFDFDPDIPPGSANKPTLSNHGLLVSLGVVLRPNAGFALDVRLESMVVGDRSGYFRFSVGLRFG